MSGPSIPDRAAAVINAVNNLDADIARLRALDAEWTLFTLMKNEITGNAADALSNAWSLLSRLQVITREHLALIERNKP